MKHTFFKVGQNGRNDILSYFLTIILVGVIVVIAQLPITALILKNGDVQEVASTGNIDIQNLGVPEWLGLALMLLSFAAGLFGLIWLAKAIHKKRPLTMFTPFEKMNWSKVGFSALLWLALATIAELIAYAMSPEMYSFTFDAKRFFPVLIISLLMFPLQTTFEEVFFRGYLMQGFGLAFKTAAIPLIVTSVLFGLMHGANPEVSEFGKHILWYYVGTGLFLGIITLMDETLELAMGVHAANNLFGALLVTFPSSALPTPALFTISEYNVPLMIGFWVVMVIVYTIIVQRKYEWTNWKKLVEKIEFDNDDNDDNESV